MHKPSTTCDDVFNCAKELATFTIIVSLKISIRAVNLFSICTYVSMCSSKFLFTGYPWRS